MRQDKVAKLMKKWADALRSDKYRQSRKRLKQGAPDREKRHCCLGVLCEIVPEVEFTYKEHLTHPSKRGRQWYAEYKGEQSYTRLPEALVNDLNIDKALANRLFHMNDGRKEFDEASFDQIATLIEQELVPSSMQE